MLPCTVISSLQPLTRLASPGHLGFSFFDFSLSTTLCRPLTSFLSHCSALFGHSQKPKPRLFKQVQTLFAKHPGWHASAPPFASLCAHAETASSATQLGLQPQPAHTFAHSFRHHGVGGVNDLRRPDAGTRICHSSPIAFAAFSPLYLSSRILAPPNSRRPTT